MEGGRRQEDVGWMDESWVTTGGGDGKRDGIREGQGEKLQDRSWYVIISLKNLIYRIMPTESSGNSKLLR